MITIATVVRNDKEGFLATARSILSQNCLDIEWIVIDGLSTDGTTDVVKKFEDRIDILCIESDTGVYNAMNKAIHRATGDWLIFMNAGDVFYSKSTLNEMVQQLSPETDDVVFGSVIGLEDMQMKFHREQDEFYLGMTFDHQAAMVRTSLYKGFLYDESFKISGDFDFFSRLRIANKSFRKLPWLIVTLKPYDNGLSSDFEKRLTERVRVIKSYFSAQPWQQIVWNETENYIKSNNVGIAQKTVMKNLIFGIEK